MTDILERLTAALSGRYRIERELGAGGMATVFLAEDLKHDRRVAIKVLKPELTAVLGGDRFLQEIKTTASLQHPHILPLFDSGEAGGFLFYVMPYIEGETLRAKLDRETQLGIDEAVRIAREVADALDYAHRNGIVHRDIKPENILLHDGRPVVADFGIALAVSAAAGGRMTETGTSIGTPHYMAPEQATGDRQITGRADIYSLGSVLYEMLAGEPPHTGSSAQAVIMKIIAEPVKPVASLRKTVPSNVSAAVMMALEKLPADRFESAKAFADALVDPHFTGAAASGATGRTDRPARGALIAGATLAVFGLLAALWGWQRSQAANAGPTLALALDVDVPGVDGSFFDISPAGDAFVLGTASGIAVRVRGQRTFRVLDGTRGGSQPVFSPSGDTILFSLAGRLRRIAVAGGSPLTVLSTDTVFAAYPQWGEDGTIAFLGSDGIRLIEPGAAESRLLTGTRSGRPTAVLPDGSGVLYAEIDSVMQLRLFDRAADSSIVLLDDAGVAEYVGTGHIIVARQARGLFALPFDLDRRVPTGPPVAVLPDAGADALNKTFAVSASGTLMYVEIPDIEETLVRVGAGGGIDTLRLPAQRLAYVRYSPDGRTLAIAAGSGRVAERHIGLFDLAAGSFTQWTFEGGAHGPVWSPDGHWIAYSAELPGSVAEDLYIQPLDGSTPARRVTSLPTDQHASAWPTANALLFADQGIRMIDPFATDPTPTDWLATQQAERTMAVSPDGRLAAYVADVAGDPHVFVRRFPDAGVQTRVSRDPGYDPRWSADGRRLLYLDGADQATVLAARLQREPRLTVLGIDTVAQLPNPFEPGTSIRCRTISSQASPRSARGDSSSS